MGTGAPSGTVTFLFTDIEGSTRLWDAAPDAMRAALERHDPILRSAIEGHGGYVFSTGGMGSPPPSNGLVKRSQPQSRRSRD